MHHKFLSTICGNNFLNIICRAQDHNHKVRGMEQSNSLAELVNDIQTHSVLSIARTTVSGASDTWDKFLRSQHQLCSTYLELRPKLYLRYQECIFSTSSSYRDLHFTGTPANWD